MKGIKLNNCTVHQCNNFDQKLRPARLFRCLTLRLPITRSTKRNKLQEPAVPSCFVNYVRTLLLPHKPVRGAVNATTFVAITSKALTLAVNACWPLHQAPILSQMKWPERVNQYRTAAKWKSKSLKSPFGPFIMLTIDFSQSSSPLWCSGKPGALFNLVTNKCSWFFFQTFGDCFSATGGRRPASQLFIGVVCFDGALNKNVFLHHKCSASRDIYWNSLFIYELSAGMYWASRDELPACTFHKLKQIGM